MAEKDPFAHLDRAPSFKDLLIVPMRYEDYTQPIETLDGAHIDEQVCLRVTVDAHPNAVRGYARRGQKVPHRLIADSNTLRLRDPFSWACFRLEVDAHTAHGEPLTLTVFGAVQPWKEVEPGEALFVHGKLEQFRGQWQLNSARSMEPSYEGQLVPIYPLAAKTLPVLDALFIDNGRINRALVQASEHIVHACGGASVEAILDFSRSTVVMPNRNAAPPVKHDSLYTLLLSLHAPASLAEGKYAQALAKRLCVLAMQHQAKVANTRVAHPDAPIGASQPMVEWANEMIAHVEQLEGFTLTGNQKEVITRMSEDFQKDTPLLGLLSGEVGAGKTMSYIIPAAVAHRAGAKVAIVAPTLLLANQIANELSQKLGDFARVERVYAGKKIKDETAILVSTIGLNSVAKKADYQPDVIFFDEQHKLNTLSRETLVGDHTHTVEISATPIPRSLALSFYDGVTLYTLDEQPVKKDVQTSLIDNKHRGMATTALRQAIENNQRAAIIFTLVEEASPTTTVGVEQKATRTSKKEREQAEHARSAAVASYELFAQHFPDKVVLLHGKMTDNEKEEALDAFRRGDKPLMITTTIFETGIDVPDVSTLIIRDPENLGLSQLHQLRGRLARKGGKGNCFLLCDDLEALSEVSYERLTFFTQTNNGYDLALHDLKASGAGELTGYQQRGKSTLLFDGVKLHVDDFIEGERFDAFDDTHAPIETPTP